MRFYEHLPYCFDATSIFRLNGIIHNSFKWDSGFGPWDTTAFCRSWKSHTDKVTLIFTLNKDHTVNERPFFSFLAILTGMGQVHPGGEAEKSGYNQARLHLQYSALGLLFRSWVLILSVQTFTACSVILLLFWSDSGVSNQSSVAHAAGVGYMKFPAREVLSVVLSIKFLISPLIKHKPLRFSPTPPRLFIMGG